jgi:MFS superfamily sulfate permease-like transporter
MNDMSKLNEINKALHSKVNLKIVSSRGHDEITDSAANVLDRIKQECDDNGKWAYINGTQTSPESITLESLLDAEDITLTNALVGG